MAKAATKDNDSTANLGFEAGLLLAADKLRNSMDAAEYKHVVLGLTFLSPALSGFIAQAIMRVSRCRAWGRFQKLPDKIQ